jgi:single-stranded DNA-binding protein
MYGMGICNATVVGHLVETPNIISGEGERNIIESVISVVTHLFQNGERIKHESRIRITAAGPAADNILRNYFHGKRAYVSGPMQVLDNGPSIHVTQLLWMDAAGL